MKPLSARSISVFSARALSADPLNIVEICRHCLQISLFSTSASSFHSHPSSSAYSSRRQEDESRQVRVSVWWDFENCTLPVGSNVFKVAHSITAAVRANGMKGPIQITAFGDVLQLSRPNQEALSSTGINLIHVPHGGKNSADRSLLVDLMYWVSQNPPPAHLFIISGDRDFASILHRLRMNNYNILLASPETAPGVLCSAASIMWHWHALVKGENLTGKHFNQPPDGPHGSWYGYYRVPLEDPFAVSEQPACSQAEELCESGSDAKLRPVPRVVVRQLRQILNSFPKGISITDLRLELAKSNVSIDKDLYGFKKFSRFLLSMPNILKLQAVGEGQLFVHSINPKAPEPVESIPAVATGPAANKREPDIIISPKSNGEDGSNAENVLEKSSMPSSSKSHVKVTPMKLQESQTEVQEPTPVVEIKNNAEVTENHLHPAKEHSSVSEVGFFKRIWRKWFGDEDSSSNKKFCNTLDNNSCRSTGSSRIEQMGKKSTGQNVLPVSRASFSSSSHEVVVDEKTAESLEAYGDKSSGDHGFFNRIMSWCQFWRSPTSNKSNIESCEKLDQMTLDSGEQEIFLKESFWEEMQAFIDTPAGSAIVLQSRNRDQMARNLQKQGPLVLNSLRESDLLQLVNLLILERKWVEECPRQAYPFKVIRPGGKSSFSSNQSSNGLRSVFLGEPSQSSPNNLSDSNGEKRYQNTSSPEISPANIDKKPAGKSRNEILADCQELVDDVLKVNPEGFNMGPFRKLFRERYGYNLDLQKLGHQKLATLLQTMPGVKILSTYIIPAGKISLSLKPETVGESGQENNASGTVVDLDSEFADASRRDDDLESPWEELGPVSITESCKNVKKRSVEQRHHDYEAPPDDDFSDSEDEPSYLTGSEGGGKAGVKEDDSSLLKILNAWYSSNEENTRRNGSENVNGVADSSPNGSSGVGIKTEMNYGRKQRPSRSYSFVSNRTGNDKDKLVDGILGNLKKSGELRNQSQSLIKE